MILLSSFFLTNNSYGSIQKIAADFLKKQPVLRIGNSKTDSAIARTFDVIYRDLRKNNILSLKNGKYLHSLLSRNKHSFKNYSPLAKTILKISKNNNNLKGLATSCFSKTLRKLSGHGASITILKELDRYCKDRFLHLLSKKKYPDRIREKYLMIFSDNLNHYLKSRNSKTLQKYLKRFSKNKALYKLISDRINHSYVINDIKPDPRILSLIDVKPLLHESIHTSGLKCTKEQNTFTNEFRKISRKVSADIMSNMETATSTFNSLQKFFQNNKQFIDRTVAWKHFISIGKELLRVSPEDAEGVFKFTIEIAPASKKTESYFYYLWAYIYQDKISDALEIVGDLKLNDHKKMRSSRLAFWIAYIYEKDGDVENSNKIFRAIIEENPVDYYAAMSFTRLLKKQKVSQKEIRTLLLKDQPKSLNIKTKDYSNLFKNSIRRLMSWLRTGNQQLSTAELGHISKLNKYLVFKKNKVVRNISNRQLSKHLSTQLSALFTTNKEYLTSFKLIYKAIGSEIFTLSKPTLAQLFPTQYLDKIKSIDSGIDPIVVLSLIRQESAFNPKARSPAGARGLMQLMPATARMYKRKVKNYQLKNPNLNLTIGMKYLKRLLKRYDGNLIYSLAAYNAGETRVKKWSAKVFPEDSDTLLTIESIPFLETRKYVKLIFRNIFFYNLIFDKGSETPLNLENYYKI